jgi:hypothetical protein
MAVVCRQTDLTPYWPSSTESDRQRASIAAQVDGIPPTNGWLILLGVGVCMIITPCPCLVMRLAAAFAVMKWDCGYIVSGRENFSSDNSISAVP